MDPKSDDPSSAGGDPEECTVALKRSRRVSFAETTAVHVFVRDEDFETPPDSNPPSERSKPGSEEDVGLGFRGDRFDSEEDDDDDGEQEKFVRDMDSSSPGSAAGSVASNDDDNFFGPVSTSFIKSGRLSEAGTSDDDNHDMTLDSTAFSLHFQNVVPPDDRSVNSAGSFRTPTGESVPTDSYGFIASKGFSKQTPCSKISDENMSGGVGDSGNMSFIVENEDSYNHYEKSSPTLDALLVEIDKAMQNKSPIYSSGTRMLRDDNYAAAVGKESANDATHVCSMDAVGKAVDTFFDPDILKGRPVGIDSDWTGIGLSSPNKEASLPMDVLTNEKTQATPNSNGYYKDVHETIQSNPLVDDVQKTPIFSPPDGKSFNNMTSLYGDPKLSPDQVKGSNHPLDSSPQSMPALPVSAQVNVQRQLLSEHGMQTPQNAMPSLQSPLLGSISSLCSKRQQLFLDPSVLSQNGLMHSPDKEEPLSSLKMKLTQHGERISAIKIPKSISHKSPNIIDARSALLEKYPMPHENECVTDKNCDSAKYMGVSASNVKDSPINAAKEAGECSVGHQLHQLGSFTTSDISVVTNLAKNEVVSGSVKLSTGISSMQPGQSEINEEENLLPFDTPIEQAPLPDMHASYVGQTAVKESEPDQTLDSLHSIVSFPVLVPGDEIHAAQGTHFSPKVDGAPSSGSLLKRNKVLFSKSFTVPNSDKMSKLQSSKDFVKNDSPFHQFQEQIEGSKDFHVGNQDQNVVMEKHLVNMKYKPFADDLVSSNKLPSESANKPLATVNIRTEFLAGGTIQSPCDKMDGDENILHSLCLKDSLSSEHTEDPNLHDNGLNCQDIQSVQETHSVETRLSGKKRGIEQTLLASEDRFSEESRMQKSQKVLAGTIDSCPVSFSGWDLECSKEPVGIKEQAPLRHWKDILSKVFETTKQIFSPPICQLTTVELDILEDILGELQTARKYERLYSSLRNHICLGEHQRKRVAEARSLLDKLVYEKAKLQLKRMKLANLSNKAKLCKSKVQECAKLKSSYAQFCALDARTVQYRESQCHSGSNNPATDQVEYCRVTSMRHELEMLDQKVKHMTKTFETSCKITGTTSCDEIIKIVNDHIEMKNRLRLIQQDLQLWKLRDIVKKNDQLDVVLDYCNLLVQRFTIQSRSVSSIVSIKVLNKESIEKNFPNMSACIAFEFVFKARGEDKVFSLKQLSQEMLETKLFLGTLLDVLEEVLGSRMQSWNLFSSTFHFQSSGQLELRLSFLSFKSGWRVTIVLDLTILNCAAYPSTASDLKIQILEAESRFPPWISDKITGAVESLEDGRSMIVRLCRSVSKVIRDSDGL